MSVAGGSGRAAQVAVVSGFTGAVAAALVNAATLPKAWPWGLEYLHQRWWLLVPVAAVVAGAGAFVTARWMTRLELDDDTSGSDRTDPVFSAGPRVVLAQQIGSIEKLVLGDEVHHHELATPVVAGQVVNLPPRNPDFTGRDDLLADVLERMASGPVAVVAVHGLGGIGKTQLAIELAHRGFVKGRYEVAWWVRAETPLTIAEDLAGLGPGLGVPAMADQEKMIAAVRAELSRRSRWLVVLDNAEDADTVRSWIPSGSGDVLITSRSRAWAGLASTVQVEVFTRVESLAYLKRRTGETGAPADELAEVLGDLPLALSQAAAFIERAGGLSITAYLRLLQDRQTQGRLLAAGAGDGYPTSVATTWLMHLDWLAEHAAGGLELLRFCAMVNPDEINLTVLCSQPDLLDGDLTGRLAAACRRTGGLVEATAALVRSGLLTRLDDDRVRMHRLVSQVTSHQLETSPGRLQAWADHATALLARLVPDDPGEPHTWPVCAELAPHILVVAEHTPSTPDTAIALVQLCTYLRVRAEYPAARRLLHQALAIFEAADEPDQLQVARTAGNLGLLERELGELESARTHQQQALATFEALFGPDSIWVARALTNLGTVEQELGELEKARQLLLRALTIKEEIHGPDHPEAAATLINLGIIEKESGELELARRLQMRALMIEQTFYGPDHPEVARALTNLGTVEHELGELEMARQHQQRALAIAETVYGPDHPEVAITLCNLGLVERELGGLETAQQKLLRALAIFEATLGPEHANTLEARRLLARSDEEP